MNRLLSVVRSMIDKIIELSRAVVNEARYGESIGGAASIRAPERRSCHLASTLRRPATGPGDVGSVCRESVGCDGHSRGVVNGLPGTRRTTHSIFGVSDADADHGGRHARRRITGTRA